jgi:hypothetical protein
VVLVAITSGEIDFAPKILFYVQNPSEQSFIQIAPSLLQYLFFSVTTTSVYLVLLTSKKYIQQYKTLIPAGGVSFIGNWLLLFFASLNSIIPTIRLFAGENYVSGIRSSLHIVDITGGLLILAIDFLGLLAFNVAIHAHTYDIKQVKYTAGIVFSLYLIYTAFIMLSN